MQAESNGYVVLSDAEPPGADSQMTEGCEHSSDEEKEAHQEEEQQQEAGTLEIHAAALDCSCSRPLLLDSEDEEEQQAALHSSKAPTQPSTSFHQPPASTYVQNHSQQGDNDTDIFLKGPSRIGPEDAGDVFANAPFPRAALPAQQQLDVFSQAPFGKRKEAAGAQPKILYPQTGGVQGATPDQAVFGHVAQQPFRPQALSKYSRHFEGPILQQPAAAQRVMSDVHSQAAVVVPVGPPHSWTSEVSPVDPFITAPFPLKAPQEKP